MGNIFTYLSIHYNHQIFTLIISQVYAFPTGPVEHSRLQYAIATKDILHLLQHCHMHSPVNKSTLLVPQYSSTDHMINNNMAAIVGVSHFSKIILRSLLDSQVLNYEITPNFEDSC